MTDYLILICFQVAGNQILDHIHNRASVSGSPEVLLLSNSIKSLVLASSPSQVQSAHVSTPVQIAKNMITYQNTGSRNNKHLVLEW